MAARNTLKNRTDALVMVAATIGLAAVLNALATQTSARLDLTEQKVHTLSDASTNAAHAIATATLAPPTESAPDGISRDFVRGFRASTSRSTIRLNPIAANRAAVKATTTHTTFDKNLFDHPAREPHPLVYQIFPVGWPNPLSPHIGCSAPNHPGS
jgi:hypothetical protein